MVKNLPYSCLFFILSLKLQAQQINPYFCGQNAWLPSTFTDFSKNPDWDIFDPIECDYCTVATGHIDKTNEYPWGELDNHWLDVKNSGSRMVRVGGTTYNKNKHEFWDYRWQVERIKENGMIPVVQVPVGDINTHTTFLASEAADIVDYLNNENGATAYTEYWIIGNEYDLGGISLTVAQCSTKIALFSQAMKAIDPNIKIIGPELSTYYDGYAYAEDLIALPNFLSYIDYFSFHMYPQNTITACDTTTCTGNRTNYINFAKDKFKDNKLTSLMALIGNKPIAVTEFNVTGCSDACSGWDINPAIGYDARSFIAGQMIADLFLTGMAFNNGQVKFMNMHSVIEGDPDRGFLQVSNGLPRSSYYHFQMVAQNFKGIYVPFSTTPPANIKVFGARNSCGKVVMIMNQNEAGTAQPFRINPITMTIDFNPQPPIPANAYDGTIPNESTLLIKFNKCNEFINKLSYSRTINEAGGAPEETGPSDNPSCRLKCREIIRKPSQFKCSNNNPPPQFTGVINNSITLTDSAIFSGTVIIPNNVTLKMEKLEAAVSESSKILVLPGGKLIIEDSYLSGCEGKMWDGIVIKGNNNLSGQLVIERSSITDAVVAVKTDKTNDIFITENIFKNGTTAIEMNKNKGFAIKKNQFTSYTYGIKTQNTIIKESIVQENSFYDVKYALYFENDEHTKLVIKCNHFIDYTEHAIKSLNTNLKDQGSLYEGAGNEFVSASIQINDKLSHQGNAMKYFYEPSNPIISGMNVQTMQSQGEACMAFSQRLTKHELESEIYSLNEANSTQKIFIENIPNPANDETTFNYYIPAISGKAQIKIIDLPGQIIAIYPIIPGNQFLTIDCSSMKSGIYFYTLEIEGNPVQIKKMALAK